jgi:hypothetical protein
MFAACLLLLIATLGGTLLTFLYDRSGSLGARMCMGACIGPVLLTTVGFLSALWLGLGPGCILLSATVLLLPLLLLYHGVYRRIILDTLRASKQSISSSPAGKTAGYLFFYLALAVLLGMVFSRAAYERPDGIFTGITNNLGDLPLHLQVIASFDLGHNLPPEDPTYAGVRFAYPFFADFLAAMLVRTGATVIGAMWLENMTLGMALVGLMHYGTLLLTRNRLAGLIAPVLIIFSGGLGWCLFFQDAKDSADGIFSLLGNLPHDYTIMPDSIFRWGNALTTLFVPQRSLLFGIPMALVIFCQWWLAVTSVTDEKTKKKTQKHSQPTDTQRIFVAGILAGLLPLVHAHTFLVVVGTGACLAILFRPSWRRWLIFFATALVVALPELVWLARSGGVHAQSYLGWQPGWDHGSHNLLWFWFVNTGIFIPLLILALAWRRADLALPPRLLKFYAPFLLCFIVPNLIKLAPWIWDNIKVIFLWYVASVPLVAWLLARWWQKKSFYRWLAAGALAAMVLAGTLDILRVITDTTEYQEFDIHAMAIADVISQRTGPRAVVLHAPTYNSPVFLTGRRSLLGYPGWMWSRGLDYSQRSTDIQKIYAGEPEAEQLLLRYRVEYVLISPAELSSLHVDEQFWSRYSKIAQMGDYRLYKTNILEERPGK